MHNKTFKTSNFLPYSIQYNLLHLDFCYVYYYFGCLKFSFKKLLLHSAVFRHEKICCLHFKGVLLVYLSRKMHNNKIIIVNYKKFYVHVLTLMLFVQQKCMITIMYMLHRKNKNNLICILAINWLQFLPAITPHVQKNYKTYVKEKTNTISTA